MPVRETFWNIPHWAELAQYFLGLAVVLIFAYGVYRHIRLWGAGKPEKRTDQPGLRLRSVFTHAVLQARLAKDLYAGIMHLAIFWGMVVLLLGTALATIDWDLTHLLFDFQFLTGWLFVLYELALDLFGILLLVGLGMAIYRRYVKRPQGLRPVQDKLAVDDAYTLGMLILVGISGFLVEGLRIAVVQPDWANWSPVGTLLAGLFTSLGDPLNRNLHLALWSSHTLVSFTLIASIPFTKLFHLVTVPTNIYFRSLNPAGQLAPARYGSGPGIKGYEDFTWKQRLDFDACIRCGRCHDRCPATASGVSFSPRDTVIRLGQYVRQKKGKHLYDEVVQVEEVWACTTCRACVQACPAFIDHVATLVDMRRHLTDAGKVDPMLQDVLSNLGRYGNSFGQSERARARWAQAIEPKIKDARKEAVEYLWVVGDTASYNSGLSTTTVKTAEIFQQAGLDFGILYETERNSGNDVRRVGEEGLFEMLVEKNSVAFGRSTFEKVITTDPHTYNTLKNEYPREALNGSPVMHYSELFDNLIQSGQLRLARKLNYRVTYHDPCYLSRYNGIEDAPRRVIEATGCTLVEMPRNREQAFCCGAGGGRIWMEEQSVKERPSEMRVREAASLQEVNILVVACPKDAVLFRDALKTCSLDQQMRVMDLSDLVFEAVQAEGFHG